MTDYGLISIADAMKERTRLEKEVHNFNKDCYSETKERDEKLIEVQQQMVDIVKTYTDVIHKLNKTIEIISINQKELYFQLEHMENMLKSLMKEEETK